VIANIQQGQNDYLLLTDKIMEKGDRFIILALEYKKKYKATKWWKFKKRRYYESMRKSAIDCAIRFG